jgi:hypothetical protein
MKNPPFRSPREKVGGMYHFGRMLDKVRLHVRGELPDEYKPNLGLALGLDGHCCAFLEVEFVALVERITIGGTDDEILEWCFTIRTRACGRLCTRRRDCDSRHRNQENTRRLTQHEEQTFLGFACLKRAKSAH